MSNKDVIFSSLVLAAALALLNASLTFANQWPTLMVKWNGALSVELSALILGLVLGRLIEKNLFISYARYEFTFLLRPVLLVIIAVGVALILAPLVQSWFARRVGLREELIAAEEG